MRPLLRAWVAIGGSSSTSGLCVSVPGSPLLVAESFTAKLCYDLLLLVNPCHPHCVTKFSLSFPDVDWPSTWSSLFFMPLDRQVSDLCWRVAHGVLYSADRLISFGYNIPASCFCGFVLESPSHLFLLLSFGSECD